MLDPFCGTGRVCLAAAEAGASAVGIDLNPLALLISRAKAHSDNSDNLLCVLAELLESRGHRHSTDAPPLDPRAGRHVEWLGPDAARELREITKAINNRPTPWPTRLLLAAVLSATVREVSFARRDQWKLHRLSAPARLTVPQDAWSVFERRLTHAWRELHTLHPLPGCSTFALGDARHSPAVLRRALRTPYVDAVITSPPYGDSQSTVQYGGMSSLCLHVVSRLRGFSHYGIRSAQVDTAGLGGRPGPFDAHPIQTLRPYWAGGANNPRRASASAYLRDLHSSLRAAAACLRPGGAFVTVIARRLIGGWRLRTDEFVDHTLLSLGFSRVDRTCRRIAAKVTPPTINRLARTAPPSGRRTVKTMREEWILVHQAPHHAPPGRPR